MNINSLLKLTNLLAEKNNISQPYLVGGVPRDRFLGKIKEPKEIKDLDLTTGNVDAVQLGKLVAKSLDVKNYRLYDDGHSSLSINGVMVDFSSHFIIPGI